MKTFAIDTLGCKVNQYESQQIRELLERLQLREVESPTQANLVVVNTCCVTRTASSKSRQCIRKARRLSPDATIVVCGCLPTAQNNELHDVGADTSVVRNQDDLPSVLNRIIKNSNPGLTTRISQPCSNNIIRTKNRAQIKQKNPYKAADRLPQLTSFKGHTRAFLKVQDGCDGSCTYCIIPTTRPIVRSKLLESALSEARSLAKAGHKEIVVTGIFLGAYGQETVRRRCWPSRENDNLATLLESMAEIPELVRIRLSSLEPADVTPRLLQVFQHSPKMMPHLHLSLQSGSDAVLKRMCRQYTAGQFLQTIRAIRARLDRPAITTDIIVGFPGETDADFEQTVKLAKHVGFAKMHVFSFSLRQGTAAASMKDSVAGSITRGRAKLLQGLDRHLGAKFRQQFVGETTEVLLEEDGGRACGRSERYFRVYLDKTDTKLRRNQVVRVKLLENTRNGMIGKLAQGDG
jgi:threonylcarbamoyladenosine tRNA methylthiotransferase MtaB